MKDLFAAETKVPVERSRAELDTILARYGATARAFVVDDAAALAQIGFRIGPLQYRMDLPLPALPERRPRGWGAWPEDRRQEWIAREKDQALRTRWRVLLLLVKAKLEAVSLGVSTAEAEFLPHLLLGDGRTVYAALGERIACALAANAPLMLSRGGR
jgi:hypothetical protein